MRRIPLDIVRICVGHNLDACWTRLEMARIWSEHDLVLFFFQLFDGQKKTQRPKNPSLFRNFFQDVNRKYPIFFGRGIGNIYDIY